MHELLLEFEAFCMLQRRNSVAYDQQLLVGQEREIGASMIAGCADWNAGKVFVSTELESIQIVLQNVGAVLAALHLQHALFGFIIAFR